MQSGFILFSRVPFLSFLGVRSDTMSLAQRVRDHRYTRGWGPDELAHKAEISRTALYQIESGKTELPRAGTLKRIALALDVSMESLLGHGEPAHAAGNHGSSNGGSKGQGYLADWLPPEGGPMSSAGRLNGKFEPSELSRFGVEYNPYQDGLSPSRENELIMKFRELLATAYGEPMARIVEEAHRMLPQASLAGR
jgi:transcriptional regulator with XRE-family HTH domain